MSKSRSRAKSGTPSLPRKRPSSGLDRIGCPVALGLACLVAWGLYKGQPQHSGYSSRSQTDIVGTTSDPTSSSLERAMERRGPPEPFKPRTVDHLVVNLDDSFSTVVKKSREDGFRELLELAKTAAQEEMWMYIPSIQTWYEVGYDAQILRGGKTRDGLVSQDRLAIRPNASFIEELGHYYVHLEDVHIHPPYQNEIETNSPSLSLVMRGMPSDGDLENLLLAATAQRGALPKAKGSYTAYVVSPLGVTKYKLTEAGIRRYFQAREQYGSEGMLQVFGNDLPLRMGFDGDHPDIDKEDVQIRMIEDICRGLSSPYLNVTFTPYTVFEHKE